MQNAKLYKTSGKIFKALNKNVTNGSVLSRKFCADTHTGAKGQTFKYILSIMQLHIFEESRVKLARFKDFVKTPFYNCLLY